MIAGITGSYYMVANMIWVVAYTSLGLLLLALSRHSTTVQRLCDIFKALTICVTFVSFFGAVSTGFPGALILVGPLLSPVLFFSIWALSLPSDEDRKAKVVFVTLLCGAVAAFGAVFSYDLYRGNVDGEYAAVIAEAARMTARGEDRGSRYTVPVTGPLLQAGHFIILQDLDAPNATHFTGNHGFPLPATIDAIQRVVSVVRQERSLPSDSSYSNSQVWFTCAVLDLRSHSVLAINTLAGSAPVSTSLPTSIAGSQPWSEFEQWVESIM